MTCTLNDAARLEARLRTVEQQVAAVHSREAAGWPPEEEGDDVATFGTLLRRAGLTSETVRNVAEAMRNLGVSVQDVQAAMRTLNINEIRLEEPEDQPDEEPTGRVLDLDGSHT